MYSGIVVIDDSAEDGLVPICSDLNKEGMNIRVEKISDFIRYHGIEFVGGEVRQWLIGEKKHLNANCDQLRILDRVVEISPKSIAALEAGNGELLFRGQVSSVYERLLRDYGAPLGVGRAYSTVGRLLPLPTQWHIVADQINSISIPSFKYGYGPEPVSCDDFEKPIFKSPFDLYSWKQNDRPDEVVWDEFIVNVPNGAPVLSYVLGHKVVTTELSGQAILSDGMKSRLSELSLEVAIVFDAVVGEVLWFVEDSNVVFAAFSHFLSAACRNAAFPLEARTFLKTYFSQSSFGVKLRSSIQ